MADDRRPLRVRPAPRAARLRGVWLVACFVFALPRAGATQQAPPPAAVVAEPPGTELTISLLTMGPGDAVWERFGHNAVWIHDAARGTDRVYNWGLFDFQQRNFVPRFLSGRMRYSAGVFDLPDVLAEYAARGRGVSAQQLRLTPAERAQLRDFAEWNVRPENREYAYDYYRDNCSTRIRDAIDRAVGGRVRSTMAQRSAGSTYRVETRRMTGRDPVLYAGIMLALGRPADRPISMWRQMFLPAKLRDHLRNVEVVNASGRGESLIASETVLVRSPRTRALADRSPPFLLHALAAGLALAAVFAFLGEAASRGSRKGRVGLALLGGFWWAASGVAGAFLLIAWAATRHVFMHRNENLLLTVPLSMALAVLLPLALLRGRARTVVGYLTLVVAIMATAGLALKALPGAGQDNGEVIALALPATIGLAYATWRALRTQGG